MTKNFWQPFISLLSSFALWITYTKAWNLLWYLPAEIQCVYSKNGRIAWRCGGHLWHYHQGKNALGISSCGWHYLVLSISFPSLEESTVPWVPKRKFKNVRDFCKMCHDLSDSTASPFLGKHFLCSNSTPLATHYLICFHYKFCIVLKDVYY